MDKYSRISLLVKDLGLSEEDNQHLRVLVEDLLIWYSSGANWESPLNKPLLPSYHEDKWAVTIQSQTSRKQFRLKGQMALQILFFLDCFALYDL